MSCLTELQMKLAYIYLLIGFCIPVISGCAYSETNKRIECSTSVVTKGEEGKEWSNLMIFENTRTLRLRTGAFVKTPNLKKLTVKSVQSLEVGIFDTLTKLEELAISFANLQEVPLGLIDNLNIKTFQFYDAVKKIPAGFFIKNTNLQEVIIRNNTLLEIKTGIFINTLIKVLYLNYNEIRSIEYGAFYNMKNLILLNLKGNKLATFDPRALLGETNLQTLWLEDNEFTNITKTMFVNLNSLRQLFIARNQIEKIEDRSLQYLTKLTFFDLSNNKLRNINPKMFPIGGMTELYTFFIHNNRLSFINTALFIKAPNLRRMSYAGNPFQCPCYMETLQWFTEKNITRLCDGEYTFGSRPVCIYSESPHDRNKCLNDEELSESFYVLYSEQERDYPVLPKKCDTSNGFDKAKLQDIYL